MNPHDPIEEFFAKERDSIRPLPADEQRWTRIVATQRRSRRMRSVTRVAGVAAAAVAIGSLGWAIRPLGDEDVRTPAAKLPTQSTQSAPTQSAPLQMATSATMAPTATDQPTTASVPAPTPTTIATPTTPVPADFQLISMSQASSSTIFGLGRAMCDGVQCMLVARSDDNGAHWRQTARLSDVDTSWDPPSAVGTDRSVSKIRFANPQVGWVFGGGLQLTLDGGRTFTPVSHPGGAVVELATDGQQYAVVTAGKCTGLTCTGNLEVAIGQASGDELQGGPASIGVIESTGPLNRASIAFKGGKPLIGISMAGSPGSAYAVSDSGELEPPASAAGCANATSAAVFTSGSLDDPTYYGACTTERSDGGSDYSLGRISSSNNRWTAVGGSPTVRGPMVSWAASSADHLLVTTAADGNAGPTMQLSADGGQTWRAPTSPASVLDAGWEWVGSPGPGRYYAIEAGGSGRYWASRDNGLNWSPVQVAGKQ